MAGNTEILEILKEMKSYLQSIQNENKKLRDENWCLQKKVDSHRAGSTRGEWEGRDNFSICYGVLVIFTGMLLTQGLVEMNVSWRLHRATVFHSLLSLNNCLPPCSKPDIKMAIAKPMQDSEKLDQLADKIEKIASHQQSLQSLQNENQKLRNENQRLRERDDPYAQESRERRDQLLCAIIFVYAMGIGFYLLIRALIGLWLCSEEMKPWHLHIRSIHVVPQEHLLE